MKIIGSDGIQPRQKVVYVGHDRSGKRIGILFDAPPLDIAEVIAAELPTPPAPQGPVKRDDRGREIKDELTGVPVRTSLLGSAKHRELIAENEKLRVVALIYHCLAPNQVKFNADRDSHKDNPRKFYELIREEMKNANITSRVIDHMVNAISELNDVDQTELEEAGKAIEVENSKGNA